MALYFDQDEEILRLWEAERIGLSGPTCQYYILNRGKNVDPLYNEPVNDPLYQEPRMPGTEGDEWPNDTTLDYADSWEFEEPFDVVMAVEFQEMDNRQVTVREEGKDDEFDGYASIARNTWEAVVAAAGHPNKVPKEGDVIFVQNEWWDVVRANKGGNMLDTRVHVGYRLDLKKRTKFTPDRKV